MKHLSYIHFNFNKRHCTYADPRFIVKRLRCHLFLTNSDGYQLRWLPTELVINQFHNELITQHKILCIESIIFDSNKVSVINSFGDIEIGELHRRRKMFSAKLESANFVVGEKKIRRKCTNSVLSSVSHLVIRLIILISYYRTRFAARKEIQRDETVSWTKCETRQIGQHYFV